MATLFSAPGYTKNPRIRQLPVFYAAEINYLSVILSPKLVIFYGRKINMTKGNNGLSPYGPENIPSPPVSCSPDWRKFGSLALCVGYTCAILKLVTFAG